ncbi:leucine-rich repeat-containing protein Bf66946-like [Branchiostoma lanceolatum]|uniref:leucine-rich repeat-containing protein Bf66946-like n=1 Tax=Branchiostoma lanceolatum TaxID=7740 RepID=UPI0034565D7A
MVVHTSLVLILLAAIQSAVAYCPEACKCTPTRGGQIVTCIGSNLKTIPDGLPTDTEWLNIRDNDIQILNLDDLKTLSRLQGLDVSSNSIKTITGSFEDCPNLVDVQLYQNNLATLHPTTFGKALKWMQYVSLNNNPWDCDCNLKWLITEMDSEDSPLSSQLVKCETPEELRGNYTADIDVDKLVCKRIQGPHRLSQMHIILIATSAATAVVAVVAAAVILTRCRRDAPLPLPVTVSEDDVDDALNASTRK